MRRRNLFLLMGILVLLIAGVVAFQAVSSSYTLRIKFDSGAAGTNASSDSYVQRFVMGNLPVATYSSDSYSGRFGIMVSGVVITIIQTEYPTIGLEIARGNGATLEDDLGVVPDLLTSIVNVTLNSSGAGASNVNCSFHFDDVFIGSNLTNSSGQAIYGYDKSSETIGSHNMTVNYTSAAYDAKGNTTFVNFTIVVFNFSRGPGNKGVRDQYVDGQTAILYFNITKVNDSGTSFYGPTNINISAADSSVTPSYYPDSAYVASYRVYNTTVGQYESHVVVNKTFDSSIVWEIRISDDNYTTFIGSTSHADVGIVDGPLCGNGLLETGEECDDGNLATGDGCDASCVTEDDGGGGGGGTCTDVCSPSGSVQTTCADGNTVSERTCGDHDTDDCLEWGSWSGTDCIQGEVCVNAECTGDVCEENWDCTEWSECTAETQSRVCTDLNACETEVSKPAESQTCEVCEEDWSCDWTLCVEDDTLSYPYDCVDSNGCGTEDNKPTTSIDCDDVPEDDEDCDAEWECGEWKECNADYDLDDVLLGKTSIRGFQKRDCVDATGCASDRQGRRFCNLGIPISAALNEWCDDEYVELFDANTSELVSRIKRTEVVEFSNLQRVDISFVTTEFTGYCDYCFDGLKNHDETGLDCGGPSCPECVSVFTFFDWLFWVILILWILFLILIIILWKEEDEEEEQKTRPKRRIRDWFASIMPTTKREQKVEMAVEGWFSRMFKGKKVKMVPAAQGKMVRVQVKSHEEKKLDALKRKLREWKASGYHGTAALEARVIALEHKVMKKEKTFVQRFIGGARRSSAYPKALNKGVKPVRAPVVHKKPSKPFFAGWFGKRKEIVEHKPKPHKIVVHKKPKKKIFAGLFKRSSAYLKPSRSATGRLKRKEAKPKHERIMVREVKKQKRVRKHEDKVRQKIKKKIDKIKIKAAKIERKVEKKTKKIKRKEVKKIVKKRRKIEKVRKKVHRKVVRKKIRVLKGEMRSRRLQNLKNKLRLWKKEGYYGTAELEAEIKRLKSSY